MCDEFIPADRASPRKPWATCHSKSNSYFQPNFGGKMLRTVLRILGRHSPGQPSIWWTAERFELSILLCYRMNPVRESYVAFQHATQT